MKKVWRDDRSSAQKQGGEIATVNFCVITARDFIKKKGGYSLYIYHIISFHGNGFEAIVCDNGLTTTTEVRLGENESLYKQVELEGLKLLVSTDKESRSDFKKFLAELREHKRRLRGKKS
jgi:hypothetical protein